MRGFQLAVAGLLAGGLLHCSDSGSSSGSDAGGGGTDGPVLDGVPSGRVEKVDLLLMLDNSASMAEKHALLEQSIPDLIERLVNPPCVSGGGSQPYQPLSPSESCPEGLRREIPPVTDLHVGVISSSLGGHGADACSPASGAVFSPEQDDRAHLLGSVRPGLASYDDLGFLSWDPTLQSSPGGQTDLASFQLAVGEHVKAVGDRGCGFEAPLESWYRFLIDPEPFNSLERVPCFDGDSSNGCVAGEGIDEELLRQRRAFLRPDSALAIVMLTDENDCSVRDESQFYIAVQALSGSQQFFLPRATTPCESDPNDPCCYSCGQGTPIRCTEAGGHDKTSDTNCTDNGGFYANADEDNLNLRCWDQKRRFGIDFLYPTQRYVDALTQLSVLDHHGNERPNPIYSDLAGSGGIIRDPSLVYLLGILGVPHQDIVATAETCAISTGACPPDDPNDFRYLDSGQLLDLGRWDVILGDPANNIPPSDPFMIESSQPRQDGAQNPVTNAAIVANPNAPPTANPINGHEYDTDNGDLQYACTFPLPTPKNCDPSSGGTVSSCDCTPGEEVYGNPLCQDPSTGVQGTTQFRTKAYPSIRPLQVLKDFGENAVVASICAANPGDSTLPSFGYQPALRALSDRLKEALSDNECLPRALTPDSEGRVGCTLLEATPGVAGCDGPARGFGSSEPSRTNASAEQAALVRQVLQANGTCAGAECDSVAVCQLHQLSGGGLDACQNGTSGDAAGFCYVDESIGNPQLLADCPDSRRRRLIVVGDQVPRAGSAIYLTCGTEPEDPGVEFF